ncbi:MAG TPA: hypothetical protein V6C88_07960 [Chroococcidiopsis sp.]
MISPHLQAEQERLVAQINAIREAGEIAPPNVQIGPDFLTPKHWLLINTNLPMRDRQLGLSGSNRHRDWEERIHRRDQIQELELQLSLVEQAIERQVRSESVFVPLPPHIDFGDWVEVGGQRFQVTDVGQRYLQLTDDSGKVSRCEITQATLVRKASLEVCT